MKCRSRWQSEKPGKRKHGLRNEDRKKNKKEDRKDQTKIKPKRRDTEKGRQDKGRGDSEKWTTRRTRGMSRNKRTMG